MLTDLLWDAGMTGEERKNAASVAPWLPTQKEKKKKRRSGSRSALPAEAEGSPCRAAGAEPGAEWGSAGWPVSCAETGAESAGTRVGSLLVNNHEQMSHSSHLYTGECIHTTVSRKDKHLFLIQSTYIITCLKDMMTSPYASCGYAC